MKQNPSRKLHSNRLAISLASAFLMIGPVTFAQTPATSVSPPLGEPMSSVLSASAVYADLEAWGKLRVALSRLQGVSVSISAISVDGALIVFRYAGTPADLQAILARSGLDLTLDASGAVVKMASR